MALIRVMIGNKERNRLENDKTDRPHQNMYPWHCVMCQYQVDGQAIKKMYETHGNLRLTDHWSLGHKNGPRLPPAQLPQPWVTAVVSTWIRTDATQGR